MSWFPLLILKLIQVCTFTTHRFSHVDRTSMKQFKKKRCRSFCSVLCRKPAAPRPRPWEPSQPAAGQPPGKRGPQLSTRLGPQLTMASAGVTAVNEASRTPQALLSCPLAPQRHSPSSPSWADQDDRRVVTSMKTVVENHILGLSGYTAIVASRIIRDTVECVKGKHPGPH